MTAFRLMLTGYVCIPVTTRVFVQIHGHSGTSLKPVLDNFIVQGFDDYHVGFRGGET